MSKKQKTDVLVIGAGPVGLFTALSLSKRGIDVEIIDEGWRGSAHSYALALHPRSLRLLDEYGAADELFSKGYRVERFGVYQDDRQVSELDFSALDSPFPYLLIVPQSALESALEAELRKKKVKVQWNHRAAAIEQDDDEVRVTVARMEKYSMGYPIAHTEWMVAKEFATHANFVVGADGYHSFIRKSLGAHFEHKGAAETFVVFEVPAPIGVDNEARVMFRNGSTSVVWPLSDGQGRWSFQVDSETPPPLKLETLLDLIRERAPWFQAKIDEISWSTTVEFERRLTDCFGRGRIWLAGDAGHITGPVGVQSMNVGLSEAHDLVEHLSSARKDGGSLEGLAGYQTERNTEWLDLLGIGRQPAIADSAAWNLDQARRLLPCIPASGGELEQLLAQIGLRLT